MNYETMNWEIEVKRVECAFGIVGARKIKLKTPTAPTYFIQGEFDVADGVSGGFQVIYIPHRISFSLYDTKERFEGTLGLTWDGQLLDCDLKHRQYASILARALFHLGLLTTEVETALGTGISAHEKLEWSLEYEQRYGL